MYGTLYKEAVNQGMSPRRAITMIARQQGVPTAVVKSQLRVR